jgi:hypothetical protein
MREDWAPLPPPLLANRDEVADSLRAGNREFGAAIDEAAAFARLSERVQATHVPARLRYIAIPVFGVLALALIVVFAPRQVVTIAAEPHAGAKLNAVRPASAGDQFATAPNSPAELDPTRGRRAALVAPQRPPVSSNARQRGEGASGLSGLEKAASVPIRSPNSKQAVESASERDDASSAEAPELASRGPDCLGLARQGATHDAERCFVDRARGSGLGAEMALYELGRLRRNVLGDPEGALAALAEHRARFPAGSLRTEVEMSYLELLVQVGRSREALERSDALLQSQSGTERAAELRLLRGDVFRRKLRDLRAAEREYGLAEQLAGSAEATYLRGVCLEGLSELTSAGEAYRRYLSKPLRPRAEEVQRRLQRLSAP